MPSVAIFESEEAIEQIKKLKAVVKRPLRPKKRTKSGYITISLFNMLLKGPEKVDAKIIVKPKELEKDEIVL